VGVADDGFPYDDVPWPTEVPPGPESPDNILHFPQAERLITATPFEWRDEADLPKRQWLYGRHLLRKFLSVDVAAGGVGKSSLKVGEALALSSGRDLYGQTLHEGPLRTWLYNLEDPNEETERRVHATAKRFGIKPADLGGRLFMDSGRSQRLVIAEDTKTGARILRPVVDALIAELREREIDVLIVDPFVSSHMVSENDNMAVDMVAKQWAAIADACGCSINLIHHVRKANGMEATADSARGASSLIGAARSVMVYNRMTKEEGEKLGVPDEETRFFFRVDNDKANLAPPGSTTWYRMNNVDLDNGDSVGVACPWSPPDMFAGITTQNLMSVQRAVADGRWRENAQAEAWVGHAIGAALGIDSAEKREVSRIKTLIREWVRNGMLEVVEGEDEKRNKRKFVVVGKWAEP
jgi:hypothetical protein